jgi:hypothetical protein
MIPVIRENICPWSMCFVYLSELVLKIIGLYDLQPVYAPPGYETEEVKDYRSGVKTQTT